LFEFFSLLSIKSVAIRNICVISVLILFNQTTSSPIYCFYILIFLTLDNYQLWISESFNMKNVNITRLLTRFFVLLFLSVTFSSISAQEIKTNTKYKPHSGQIGKDVVWVPTSPVLVEKMLDIAKVTSKDFVIDLGSGDGRTVISAAKRGARARGVEFDPEMIALSQKNAAEEGVGNKVEFIQGDLFKADLSEASVITLFLLPSINLRLRPALLELKPGTRIVSNTFRMGDWDPDETARAETGCDIWCEALLWIVPAKVKGSWGMTQGQLKLDQEYQTITGTIKTGKKTIKITEGRLNGNQINFRVNKDKYSGIVDGNKMTGIVTSGHNSTTWNAQRTGN